MLPMTRSVRRSRFCLVIALQPVFLAHLVAFLFQKMMKNAWRSLNKIELYNVVEGPLSLVGNTKSMDDYLGVEGTG